MCWFLLVELASLRGDWLNLHLGSSSMCSSMKAIRQIDRTPFDLWIRRVVQTKKSDWRNAFLYTTSTTVQHYL